jgi:hypothetical protein
MVPERLVLYFVLRVMRRVLVPWVQLAATVAVKRLVVGRFQPMTAGGVLRTFPGYLKWRSTVPKFATLSINRRSDLPYNGTIWRFDRVFLKNWRPPFEVP